MYFDYKMNLYKEFYNMLPCNYSYKYILYITITIIKKAAIVFFCSHSNAYTPSINIDHLINRI